MGLLKRLFGREEVTWQTHATPAPTVQHGTPAVQHSNVVLTGDEARRAVQGLEDAMGMDLDMDGRVGTSGAPAAGPAAPLQSAPQPGADIVTQLERLAALRDSGALTPEEFAREKARLLGGP